MNLDQIVTYTRENLKETSAAHWSQAELVRKINFVTRQMVSQLSLKGAGYFERSANINSVASQEDYDLPELAVRVTHVERIAGTAQPIELKPIRSHRQEIEYRTVFSSPPPEEAYLLHGRKIKILPPASTTATSAWRVWYVKRHPDLHSGTAAAGSATTLTFPATPTLGTVTAVDDIYEGLWIEATSGTGSGQRALITDYVATTRVATFAAVSTPFNSTTVYSLVPEMPENWHEAIAYGAARDALAAASKEEASSMATLFQEQIDGFLADLGIREEQEFEHVLYTGDPL